MIKRIKERMSVLWRDIKCTYMNLMAGDMGCLTKARRASLISAATAGVMYTMTSPVFAATKNKDKTGDDGGVISNFGDMADSLSSSLSGVLTKFAGLALGVCVIWFLICTNEEDAKRPLKWGKRIIVAYVIFALIKVIFDSLDVLTGKTPG